MSMPAGLRPPLSVALARPASSIAAAGSLPGGATEGSAYGLGKERISRNVDHDDETEPVPFGLMDRFPEVAEAAAAHLPEGVILDGEAVVWRDDRLDFRRPPAADEQRPGRTGPDGSRTPRIVRRVRRPLRGIPGRAGSAVPRSTGTARGVGDVVVPPLNLSPTTKDPGLAEQWFEALTASGIEGVVVKGAAQPYVGGQRDWVKVKHRNTLDVICGAVIGPLKRPSELVLGLPVDGQLRIVGRTSSLDTESSKQLGKMLSPPEGEHPWPTEVKPGAVDRFNRGGRKGVTLTLVEPIVVEVSADVAMTGYSFRHVVRFLRPRPELDPAEVPGPSQDPSTAVTALPHTQHR